jgi:hypothetical protein
MTCATSGAGGAYGSSGLDICEGTDPGRGSGQARVPRLFQRGVAGARVRCPDLIKRTTVARRPVERPRASARWGCGPWFFLGIQLVLVVAGLAALDRTLNPLGCRWPRRGGPPSPTSAGPEPRAPHSAPPVRPLLDRDPASAQDVTGSAGDPETSARLRPHGASEPGRRVGSCAGRLDLAGRPPSRRRWH